MKHLSKTTPGMAIAALALALASCIRDHGIDPDNGSGFKAGRGDGRIEFGIIHDAQSGAGETRTRATPTPGITPLYSEDMVLTTLVGSAPPDDPHGPTTRAAVTDIASIRKIGVFGYSHTAATGWSAAARPDYFFNRAVVLDASNEWVYDGVLKYWPEEVRSLSFFAYAPHSDIQDPSYVVTPGSASAQGAPQITYTVPPFIGDQRDILWSSKPNMTYATSNAGRVPFTFDHALMMVGFEARLDEADRGRGYTVDLDEITLSGILGKGTFDLETGTWSSLEGATSYSLRNVKDFPKGGLTLPTLDTDSAGATDFTFRSATSTGDWLMLLPQTLGAGAKLKVVYTLTDTYAKTTETKTAEFPLTGTPDWTAGRHISYQLTLSTHHIPGPLAAPGVIGYIRGTNILTIRGSKEYAGTAVAPDGIGLATGQPVEDQTVYVAYFKWGSLVALGSEGGNGDEFDRNDVITGPTESGYDLDNLRNNIIGTQTGVDAWGTDDAKTVPYRHGSDTNNGWKADYANGLGDPCDYWFGDRNGTDWRLPTGNPWYSEGASPFGTLNTNWPNTGGKSSGSEWIDQAEALSFNLPVQGAVGGDGSGGKDWSMFLGATGYRNPTTGEDTRPTDVGYYWSSTPGTSSGGRRLGLSITLVDATNYAATSFAFAARCVRQEPGPLAAPGVIGYIKGTNTLTIRGSKEYKDTPVVGPNGNALATGLPLEDQTVYTAYFKWGSLIALGSEGGDGDIFTRHDVIRGPAEYNLDNLKNNIIGNKIGAEAWGYPSIPYRDGADGLRGWIADPANGLGDPCDYYFGDGDGNELTGVSWKLPRSGGVTRGIGWYPEGGSPFGTVNAEAVLTTGPGAGARVVDKTSVTPNLPDLGIVGGKNGVEDWSMFVTAVGIRHSTDGSNILQHLNSYYWSSTSYAYYDGTTRVPALAVSADMIGGDHYTFRLSYGGPVRCVRKPPGVKAPKGVIGYFATGPNRNSLTLDGDKDLGGTTGETVYVAYFKWGSLVALSSQDTGPFNSGDIVNAYGFQGGGTNEIRAHVNAAGITAEAKWRAIPYGDLDGPDVSTSTPVWPANTPANIAAGRGDPCRHHFGGTWHTPTHAQNVAFFAPPYSWAPNSGTATDPGVGTFANGVKLPASGNRHNANIAYTTGRFWSSTPSSGTNGNSSAFNAVLTSNNNNPYDWAMAIRCVQ